MLSACLVACDTRRSVHPDVLVDSLIDSGRMPQPIERHLLRPGNRRASDERHEQRAPEEVARRLLGLFRREIQVVAEALDGFPS